MNVVVVDDDPFVRLVLAKAVTSTGHVAMPTDGGEGALRLVETNDVDVVVSDWMMPGISGLELCRLIRARDAIEYVYFMLVTALDDSEHALARIAAGVDDCLVKPVRPFDLKLRMMVAERVTDLHRRLAERQRGLERSNVDLAATARQDPLTGLGNRLKLAEDLEIFRSRRDRYRNHRVAAVTSHHFRQKADTILARVAEGIVVTDGAGIVLETNPAGERLMGVEGPFVVGMPCIGALGLHEGERALDCRTGCPLLHDGPAGEAGRGREVWRELSDGRPAPAGQRLRRHR